MSLQDLSPWSTDEAGYIKYLAAERRLYASCLITYGRYSESKATEDASEFYIHEPASEAYRGLVFHDQAWHWAMIKLFGEQYWKTRPELERPSAEYLKEAEKQD